MSICVKFAKSMASMTMGCLLQCLHCVGLQGWCPSACLLQCVDSVIFVIQEMEQYICSRHAFNSHTWGIPGQKVRHSTSCKSQPTAQCNGTGVPQLEGSSFCASLVNPADAHAVHCLCVIFCVTTGLFSFMALQGSVKMSH